MCRSAPPTPISTPAPIQPRQPDLVRKSQLPGKKELVDPEDIADVAWGLIQSKFVTGENIVVDGGLVL